MSDATGKISNVLDHELQYAITTKQGASGTAILQGDALNKIVGTHTRGIPAEKVNEDARIIKSVRSNIDEWLKK